MVATTTPPIRLITHCRRPANWHEEPGSGRFTAMGQADLLVDGSGWHWGAMRTIAIESR
jgi:hypothetical protein